MRSLGQSEPVEPVSLGMETFDPYQEPTLATNAALYGGQPWCPWDPDGNYLCVCLSY